MSPTCPDPFSRCRCAFLSLPLRLAGIVDSYRALSAAGSRSPKIFPVGEKRDKSEELMPLGGIASVLVGGLIVDRVFDSHLAASPSPGSTCQGASPLYFGPANGSWTICDELDLHSNATAWMHLQPPPCTAVTSRANAHSHDEHLSLRQ